MKSFCTLIFISFASYMGAQVTFHVTQLPESTPANAELFVSGDFDGWSGGSSNFMLDHLDDNGYAITLPQLRHTVKEPPPSQSHYDPSPRGYLRVVACHLLCL